MPSLNHKCNRFHQHFSICRWAVQKCSICLEVYFLLPDGNIERKGRSENRNALLKTHNSGQESSKLIGSFCRKLIVYWTDFSEVSAALLKSCN